ncbi:MAG TPA: RusA family crossover junction endodeoxyribonuclease [Azospirillum sp.]
MADQDTLYPLEFIVEGTPRSLQASGPSKELWKERVREVARARIRETDELGFLDDRGLAVTIFYFLPEPMEGDIDNIVKPILDAMNAVAYLDDRAVERLVVQKFEPGMETSFHDVSQKLAEALGTPPPVVYIRVDDDLRWRSL